MPSDILLRDCCAILLFAASCCVSAHAPGVLLEGTGNAIPVDGVEGVEWAKAASVSFTAASPAGELPGVTLLVMNDGASLSFGLRIPGWSETSILQLRFDAGHDGVCGSGEDGLWIESPFGDTLLDSYNSGSGCSGELVPDTLGGQGTGTVDGVSAVITSTVPTPHTFFEVVHPLDSSDATYDFHLHTGNRIGFSLLLFVCHTGYVGCVTTTFPSSAVGDISLSPLFANGFQ